MGIKNNMEEMIEYGIVCILGFGCMLDIWKFTVVWNVDNVMIFKMKNGFILVTFYIVVGLDGEEGQLWSLDIINNV